MLQNNTGAPIPIACPGGITKLRVYGFYFGGSGGNNVTITVTQNTTDTILSCTISPSTINNAYTCSSSLNVTGVSAGDLIGIHIHQDNSGPFVRMGTSFVCQ